jgi:mannan endo-1,4-beta-mannosidase
MKNTVFLFCCILLATCCSKKGPVSEELTPELISSVPLNNTADLTSGLNEIKLIFNQKIKVEDSSGILLNDQPVIRADVSVNTVIIKVNLTANTKYELVVPAKIITSLGGVPLKADIRLMFFTKSDNVNTSKLVTPNPSKEAQNLMNYLKSIYANKTLSGTMANVNWNTDEADWVYAQTGKYPALNCFDFIHHVFSPSNWIDYSNTSVVENWWKAGGLVAAMWHWNVPANSGISDQYAFYYGSKSDQTLFDVSKISDENSEEYRLMIKDIDTISGYLNILKSKGIPVIWRPLHEAAGGWFWWGAKGVAPFKSLWKLMFERMTHYHHLDNLIWVWTSEGNDPDWYPGDEYVDIVGRDLYPTTNVHDSQLTEFNKVKAIISNRKMIALTECGGIPDPDLMFEKGDTWLWFMPWYGSHTRDDSHNGAAYWRTVMNNSHVITRDQMPDLK